MQGFSEHVGKRQLVRQWLRQEDIIRKYLKAFGLYSVNWINLAGDRDECRHVVNKVRDIHAP